MEFLENAFCRVFPLLGKSKYLNICLTQIKKRYSEIDYWNLQEMRVNSPCRYWTNNMNNLHSLHVLDELMENVSMWTKALPFGSNQESWVLHSPNVMAGRKAHNFVNCECRRRLLDFEATTIHRITLQHRCIIRKKYVPPHCVRERHRILEFFQTIFSWTT